MLANRAKREKKKEENKQLRSQILLLETYHQYLSNECQIKKQLPKDDKFP